MSDIGRENAVLDIGDQSRIFVGGLPPGLRVDTRVTRVGYNGCLDGLFMNQRQIGLWNIEVSCSTCR